MKVDRGVNIGVENGAFPRVASGDNIGDNIGVDDYWKFRVKLIMVG